MPGVDRSVECWEAGWFAGTRKAIVYFGIGARVNPAALNGWLGTKHLVKACLELEGNKEIKDSSGTEIAR